MVKLDWKFLGLITIACILGGFCAYLVKAHPFGIPVLDVVLPILVFLVFPLYVFAFYKKDKSK